MTEITIQECKTGGRVWKTRHHGRDAVAALALAIKRNFGEGASFHRNNELSQGRGDPSVGTEYGHIGKPARRNPGAHNMITGRVSIRANIEE